MLPCTDLAAAMTSTLPIMVLPARMPMAEQDACMSALNDQQRRHTQARESNSPRPWQWKPLCLLLSLTLSGLLAGKGVAMKWPCWLPISGC